MKDVEGSVFRQGCSQVGLFLLTFLFFFSSQAGDYRLKVIDRTVPEHCAGGYSDERFNVNPMMVFAISVEGSSDRGFTLEYPMTRGSASFLWQGFKDGRFGRGQNFIDQVRQAPQPVQRDYQLMMRNFQRRGVDFGSEGDVLELLSWLYFEHKINQSLQQSGAIASNTRKYFVTGGVEYSHSARGSAIGELDVLVGDVQTCKIIAYGEAKLGAHRSRKAWEQINRFHHFLTGQGYNIQLELLPTGNIFR